MVSQVSNYGEVTVSVPAGEKIAVFSYDACNVYKIIGYPNIPSTRALDFSSAAGSQTVSSAYAVATTLIVAAGAAPVYYAVGASPTITQPTSDISASDATFTVAGLSAAQGGYVAITGGTSSTSANAGGAVSLTGGQPGATGIGGAVSLTSGAGGATSGASGAVVVASGTTTAGSGSATGNILIQSGAGATSAVAVAGGASGSLTIRSQAGGANTGGATGQVGGAGGSVTVVGGDGGATNSTGAHAGGAGSEVTITAGTGGAATAGTGNGGKGGDIYLSPGDGGTTTGGTAGTNGVVAIKGTAGKHPLFLNAVRTTVANAGTATAANFATHVLYQDASGGAVTMTADTGANLDIAFPDVQVGNGLMVFHSSNHAANTSTISGAAGTTLVGSGAVTQTGGQYILIKTGAGTWDLVRVG